MTDFGYFENQILLGTDGTVSFGSFTGPDLIKSYGGITISPDVTLMADSWRATSSALLKVNGAAAVTGSILTQNVLRQQADVKQRWYANEGLLGNFSGLFVESTPTVELGLLGDMPMYRFGDTFIRVTSGNSVSVGNVSTVDIAGPPQFDPGIIVPSKVWALRVSQGDVYLGNNLIIKEELEAKSIHAGVLNIVGSVVAQSLLLSSGNLTLASSAAIDIGAHHIAQTTANVFGSISETLAIDNVQFARTGFQITFTDGSSFTQQMNNGTMHVISSNASLNLGTSLENPQLILATDGSIRVKGSAIFQNNVTISSNALVHGTVSAGAMFSSNIHLGETNILGTEGDVLILGHPHPGLRLGHVNPLLNDVVHPRFSMFSMGNSLTNPHFECVTWQMDGTSFAMSTERQGLGLHRSLKFNVSPEHPNQLVVATGGQVQIGDYIICHPNTGKIVASSLQNGTPGMVPESYLDIAVPNSRTKLYGDVYVSDRLFVSQGTNTDFALPYYGASQGARSAGTRILLNEPNLSQINYAIGLDRTSMWFSLPEGGFAYYSGATQTAHLDAEGRLLVKKSLAIGGTETEKAFGLVIPGDNFIGYELTVPTTKPVGVGLHTLTSDTTGVMSWVPMSNQEQSFPIEDLSLIFDQTDPMDVNLSSLTWVDTKMFRLTVIVNARWSSFQETTYYDVTGVRSTSAWKLRTETFGSDTMQLVFSAEDGHLYYTSGGLPDGIPTLVTCLGKVREVFVA